MLCFVQKNGENLIIAETTFDYWTITAENAVQKNCNPTQIKAWE
jgi:hypothetical protein